MEFGVATFVTDETLPPAQLGRAVEERGFDSVFLAEHSHIPSSRKTPYPPGGPLPREYYRTLDPFVALSVMAAVTERLLLGTGIALIVQRDPIHTANEVASLDVVSGGRAVFGVGVGWNREEMENHGTDPRTRGALADERMLAIRELWTKDEAEFHGRHVDFDPVSLWPKPVRKPHPPIYVGGASDATIRRIAEYGDGWLANAAPQADLARFIDKLRANAGREVPVTVAAFGTSLDVATLDAYAELGVERVALHLPDLSPADGLTKLDQLADLAGKAR
ncbi:LLM class F420-dependent oxidoreductase [Kutzneria sp. NPDC052558]|uniref:LLM class F420-dependent oxidoreductase n=1 Tax=Kutzneria sp. NPDC052558 TaxID=3364121 RepID=UPI0037CA61CC